MSIDYFPKLKQSTARREKSARDRFRYVLPILVVGESLEDGVGSPSPYALVRITKTVEVSRKCVHLWRRKLLIYSI